MMIFDITMMIFDSTIQKYCIIFDLSSLYILFQMQRLLWYQPKTNHGNTIVPMLPVKAAWAFIISMGDKRQTETK